MLEFINKLLAELTGFDFWFAAILFVYLTRFVAGYAFYGQKNYTLALAQFKAALNRSIANPNADEPQPNRFLKNAPTDRNNLTDAEPVLV
jgi:hypothetical protein